MSREREKKQAAKRKATKKAVAKKAATTAKKPIVQKDRERTSIRLGLQAADAVDTVLLESGLSKNAFFVMSILLSAVKLAGLIKPRKKLLNILEAEFNKELERAREGA